MKIRTKDCHLRRSLMGDSPEALRKPCNNGYYDAMKTVHVDF